MSFHPGQKVVCVKADSFYGRSKGTPEGLVVGRVYTVRWSGFHKFRMGLFGAVRLEEYIRNSNDTPVGSDRFRPVRETSIECFRAHLAPIKQHEDA